MADLSEITSGILDVKYFDPEVQRFLMNSTTGLRMATNNKGIITGNSIRFPIADIDGIAPQVSKGSPIVPDDIIATTVTADILSYEQSAKLFPEDLAATNSAASLRALAAAKVVHGMENRFTQTILTALENYDDTNMEVGSVSDEFSVETIDRVNLLADNNGWGEGQKFMLLPPEAKYTLMQDNKFYEIWSLVNGKDLVDKAMKAEDNDDQIRWTPYRGFMIGFMQKKSGKNAVGLPIAADTSLMGFAWKRSRLGFGMNQGLQTRIFEDKTKEGNPIVFKVNGSCGAAIIDDAGIIGIKMDPTPLA